MEYIQYYREYYINDLQSFKQQIPIEGNKHNKKDIFTLQYFQLTPSYNYLDILDNRLAEFAVTLFFSVLFDQAAYNQQVFGGNYGSFQKVTNYPKFIGNCTSVSEKFSQCGYNNHPISILKAINDFEDRGNSFEFDRLPYKKDEKYPQRIKIYYSEIINKAAIFFQRETETLFKKNDIQMNWTNFWFLVDINLKRIELSELLKKN